MRFHILTLFPDLFTSVLSATMLQKAQERGAVQFALVNIRDFTTDKHHVTDDAPYGGGYGMVLKPEPIVAALEAVDATAPTRPRRILLSPRGRVFTQKEAQALAERVEIALVCGRYEGIDERVRLFVDDELSVGDVVLSGGEVAALVVIDAVSRLLPGALGCEQSAASDSFSDGVLEYPHYTRPPEFRGLRVPDILMSGDHGAIARWRRQEALRRTYEQRPDLLAGATLSDDDRAFLSGLGTRHNG
jgi:tRNA (guanine37-N1)-methyltransferase